MPTKKPNPIDAAIEQAPSPFEKRTWFDALPPELQQQLSEVKAKHLAGGYHTVASVVCKVVRDHVADATGKTISLDSVKRWLTR